VKDVGLRPREKSVVAKEHAWIAIAERGGVFSTQKRKEREGYALKKKVPTEGEMGKNLKHKQGNLIEPGKGENYRRKIREERRGNPREGIDLNKISRMSI